MTEADVALSDYALAVECGVFAVLLARASGGDAPLRRRLVLFFAFLSVASLLGGTVHGFLAPEGPLRGALWRATLLSIGGASLAAWAAGAQLHFSRRTARWIEIGAAVQLALLALAVAFVSQRFWIAIAAYLPATIFLLVVLWLAYRRTRAANLRWGVLGLGLTFPAALVQQLGVSPHPSYFTHNTLYHSIQGVAFVLIFFAAREVALAREPFRRIRC